MTTEIGSLYEHYQECSAVCTDTRKIVDNCLFFALKGPNFNANDFAAEALSKGARYVVVDEQRAMQEAGTILVGDSLVALQKLARMHRDHLDIPVIGITGSNGKTTTKELIHAVLASKYQTSATSGNLNNHIGVPLTVLAITPDVEIAIVEMGANHVGEIAALCAIANPNYGLITNIGHAHIEGFGGFEGVIRGKSELFQHLLEHQGVVFINNLDPVLSNMTKRFESPCTYPQGYFNVEMLEANPFLRLKLKGQEDFTTQLIGAYNFANVAAALCLGKYFEVPMESAIQAVSAYAPQNNRSQVVEKGTNTIILDAYNANPDSMKVALDNLRSMKATHKTVILGDMKELGLLEESAHRELGIATGIGVDRVIFCGVLTQKAKEANPKSEYYVNKKELIKALQEDPIRHSTVLIKGSRSMGLEAVVDYL